MVVSKNDRCGKTEVCARSPTKKVNVITMQTLLSCDMNRSSKGHKKNQLRTFKKESGTII